MTDTEIRLTLVRDLLMQMPMPSFPASEIVERANELARFVTDGPVHIEPKADTPRPVIPGELEALVRSLLAQGLKRGAIAKRLNAPQAVSAR